MGSVGGGNEGTLALHSHLTPSGRFRPTLSWPYSVFPPAGRGEIETRSSLHPPPPGGGPVGPWGRRGYSPRRGSSNSPAGIRGYGAFAPSFRRSRGNPLVGFPRAKPLGRSLVPFCRGQKGTPRRVGETALSHQLQPNPRMEAQRWDAQRKTTPGPAHGPKPRMETYPIAQNILRRQSGAEPRTTADRRSAGEGGKNVSPVLKF